MNKKMQHLRLAARNQLAVFIPNAGSATSTKPKPYTSYPLENTAATDYILPLVIFIGLMASAAIAYLISSDQWYMGIIMLAAIPALVLLHRYPFAAVVLWLLLTPFLVATESGSLRKIYWIIHRTLPVLTIGIIVLSSMLGIKKRSFPRLGWAELAIGGYIIVSFISILYYSKDVQANTFYLYDRVVVPAALYLLIRLTNPTPGEFKWLYPVLIFIVLTQTIIGLMSWSVPQALPSAWLGRVGERTEGSLDSYSVFSATMAFCGLLLLHRAWSDPMSKKLRFAYISLAILAFFMVFFSFSRGSWLAAVIVLVGVFTIYPRKMFQLGIVLLPLSILILSLGVLNTEYTTMAGQRFYSDQSEESALSRLPIFYAAIRMFEAKPLTGWGYGNFDEYDRQFQGRVGDLINATKDHASHNVYLTLIAEQGTIGTLLFLTPVVYWLAKTLKYRNRLRKQGFWSKNILFMFWMVLVFHFIVNNFSNMRVVYGLGLWWMTLGLIGAYMYPFVASEQQVEKEAFTIIDMQQSTYPLATSPSHEMEQSP